MSGTCTNYPSPAPDDDRPRLRPLTSWLALGCRWTVGAVVLMAAVTKIRDLTGFQEYLLLHAYLPYAVAKVAAAVLPWLELTCGFFLAIGYAVREAALVCVILLGVFLLHGWIHHPEADCHCFLFPSTFSETNWWQPVRNGLLLLASSWLAVRKPSRLPG